MGLQGSQSTGATQLTTLLQVSTPCWMLPRWGCRTQQHTGVCLATSPPSLLSNSLSLCHTITKHVEGLHPYTLLMRWVLKAAVTSDSLCGHLGILPRSGKF